MFVIFHPSKLNSLASQGYLAALYTSLPTFVHKEDKNRLSTRQTMGNIIFQSVLIYWIGFTLHILNNLLLSILVLKFDSYSVKGTWHTSIKSHGARTTSIHSLQTQMWWQAWRIWQRPMSSGYWMNGPQYCTEWAHSHIEVGLLFKSSGRSHSMCTSPLRHGEQWDACTRPLPAHCRAGLLRPLGCLIKSETITFSRLSGKDACKEKKKLHHQSYSSPTALKYHH